MNFYVLTSNFFGFSSAAILKHWKTNRNISQGAVLLQHNTIAWYFMQDIWIFHSSSESKYSKVWWIICFGLFWCANNQRSSSSGYIGAADSNPGTVILSTGMWTANQFCGVEESAQSKNAQLRKVQDEVNTVFHSIYWLRRWKCSVLPQLVRITPSFNLFREICSCVFSQERGHLTFGESSATSLENPNLETRIPSRPEIQFIQCAKAGVEVLGHKLFHHSPPSTESESQGSLRAMVILDSECDTDLASLGCLGLANRVANKSWRKFEWQLAKYPETVYSFKHTYIYIYI